MPYLVCDNKCLVESPPNENLLINSDFKSGIINQKAKTSYDGEQYTIDMWLLNTKEDLLTVNNGYVTVKLNVGSLIQRLKKLDLSIPYTLIIKLKDKEPIVKTISDFVNGREQIINNVYASIRQRPNYVEFLIYLYNGTTAQTLNIEYIKLEKGSLFTGMPVWNEAEELLKCQRYFLRVKPTKTCRYMVVGSSQMFLMITLPIGMAKKPTIDFPSKVTWQTHGKTSVETTLTHVSIDNITNNEIYLFLNGNFAQSTWNVGTITKFDFDLDANEY